MTVDLKIAEALIPVYKSSATWGREGCPKPAVVNFSNDPGDIPWKYMSEHKDSTGKTIAFQWSLTGPDSGNTQWEMVKAFHGKGYDVVIESLEDGRFFIDISKADDIWQAEGVNPGEVFREAAAKALKVEVME